MSGDYHTRVIAAIKRKEFGDPEGDGGPPKKRKKRGVNPLSCLKKKPKPKPLKKPNPANDGKTESEQAEIAKKKKRKRNRKKNGSQTAESVSQTEN
jgi:U3 small nucleolar RNA-associated protein 23